MPLISCGLVILRLGPPRYLPLLKGFAYLSMITDAYSRKIVGWSLHESLQVEGPLSALKMALATSKRQLNKDLIHHSDRGVQYCSRKYTDLLRVNKIAISMTEQGDSYENALAERMNRTIKPGGRCRRNAAQ